MANLNKILNLIVLITLALSTILSPLVLDVPVAALLFLGISALFAAINVWRWNPQPTNTKLPLIRVGLLLLIIIVTIGLGYGLWWSSQPHFDIAAFDTLAADQNAYELTDQLIANKDQLAQNNIGITFTLQIRPSYYGKRRFGKLVAIISGEDGNASVVKPLWQPDFTANSETMDIQLTLPELLAISGLQPNFDPPANPFRPGEPSFRETKVTVQIAPDDNHTKPLDTGHELIIRTAPWELRSSLVWRNGRHEVDTYVQNLGGEGQFKVIYSLVRLDQEISSSDQPMLSGTTRVDFWKEAAELKRLKHGEYFTETIALPNDLAPGRYLVEIAPIKQQNFIHFLDRNTTWEKIYGKGPWWWFSGSSQRFAFIVPYKDYQVDDVVKDELRRLRDEQGIDLGTAIQPAQDVKSTRGTSGRRQIFQNGEIYTHDGKAYAIYGAILKHYQDLGGIDNSHLGFPISRIETVKSSSGEEGDRMVFEDEPPNPPSAIYASKKGVAAVWGWIGHVYTNENNGHEGWLGFPLTDEQYYNASTSQMFEYGYVLYLTPEVDGKRDYDRAPIAYPYLASRGTLFDVSARDVWQQTDIKLHPGDRVTIVQAGGSWTNREPDKDFFDANGNQHGTLQQDANLPSAAIGSLIGRVGEGNDSAFLIGRWRTFQASSEGLLYLKMNDNAYEDNAGYITVQIIVQPPEN